MSSTHVDLNADLGESFGTWVLGDDEALLDIVTSANVACGFHAGDPATLVRTCRAAAERGVVIGAQVGYRDLAGFGRRFIDIAADDLYADVVYQIGALDAVARSQGGRVRYVKPHGALYNAVVHHEEQAAALVRAVLDVDSSLPLVGLPGSQLLRAADDAGLRCVREAFADRAYSPDGSLVPRTQEGAVLHDPGEVGERVFQMVTRQTVIARDGQEIDLEADTICVHGDTPGAVTMARSVRDSLVAAGLAVQSFVT